MTYCFCFASELSAFNASNSSDFQLYVLNEAGRQETFYLFAHSHFFLFSIKTFFFFFFYFHSFLPQACLFTGFEALCISRFYFHSFFSFVFVMNSSYYKKYMCSHLPTSNYCFTQSNAQHNTKFSPQTENLRQNHPIHRNGARFCEQVHPNIYDLLRRVYQRLH